MEITESFILFFEKFGGLILGWGWVLVLLSLLWIAWKTYRLIKAIDFLYGVQWTFLQISVPVESGQTPKSMENIFDVVSGMHKPPDIIEVYFDGYQHLWYSCELHCQPSRARYIMVIPTLQRKFFEGVIYGQYPSAEIKEVEDYTQKYSYEDIEKTFDLFGVEVVLAEDDVLPIKTYREYEDTLAEDETYIDPHQALIEAFTNLEEGEEFWLQILIKPIDAKIITAWEERGEETISEIAGTAKEKPEGFLEQFFGFLKKLPLEFLTIVTRGPLEPEDSRDQQQQFRMFNPVDEARMKGILQKTSRNGFFTKMRVIYISPAGRYRKPAQSTAFGVFKQFATFHMNSFKPDGDTKTSGPTYVFKASRRRFRKRNAFLYYQWRDFFGDESGYMMTAEELATLYHFPVKYVKSPVIEHAASGLGSAPENIPYV